jgi:hypothetical protein
MNTTPKINTAKIATCNSLSGLTELQYHLGYEADAKDKIHIRIATSNGNGKFNSIFWSLAEIEDCLAGIPVDQLSVFTQSDGAMITLVDGGSMTVGRHNAGSFRRRC